jgi:FixJ family two-component response regulator
LSPSFLESVLQSGLIAIVDDEPLIRAATSSLLRSLGFDCRTFASGEELLRESLDQYLCVLSDIQMPAMDGVALAQRIHLLVPDLPIVLMTAYPSERAMALRENGCIAGLLEKPLGGDLLQKTIEAATRHRMNGR